MKTIKVSDFQNNSSEEFASEVSEVLKKYLVEGKISKKDCNWILAIELAQNEISEVHIYENYINDYNYFCGGACTTVHYRGIGLTQVLRVEPLTAGIVVGAEDHFDDPYSVALMSHVSGRCKQNQFAATVTYKHSIRKERGCTITKDVIKSLHVYLGQ